MTFLETLSVFYDNSSVLCPEIFAACARFAQKLEVRISRFFSKDR